MLVYFFKNRLPWDDINIESEEYELDIKEKKTSVPIHILCEGLPGNINFI